MKAPITPAQAWAVIAESAGWDAITALQSQAERIAELERESETHSKAYGLAIVERDRLRTEVEAVRKANLDCVDHYNDARAAIDTLRAQLAAIAATEPVAWFAFADSNGPVPLELFGWDEKACKHAVLTYARAGNWKGTVEGYLMQQGWTLKPLFTRPVPAQDVTEFDESQFKSVEDLIAYLNKLNSYRDRTLEALSKYKGAK